MPSIPNDDLNPILALAELELTESKIKFCSRFDQTSHVWNLDRHSHIYTEFLFFLRGEATIDTGLEVLSPSSYDMVVYFPNHEHQETIDLTKAQEVICLWVDTGALPAYRNGAFRLRDQSRVQEWLFIQLEKEYREKSAFSKKLVTYYLNAIFQNMLRQLIQTESLDPANKAREYINNHFTRPITVAHLAALFHVSPSYLHRVFREQVGLTPIQYITALRTQEAEYLLSSSSLSCEEIANHCGYEESRYFSRVFKKQTGYSPSLYRKRLNIQQM